MLESGMTRVTDKSLGQILIDNGIITEEQLKQALDYGREQNMRLGSVLVDLGFISRDHVYWALGIQYGVNQVEVDPDMVDQDLLARFSPTLLLRHSLLPLIDTGEEVVVVTSDPLDTEGFQALSQVCPNRKISLQLASRQRIKRALERLFPNWQTEEQIDTVHCLANVAHLEEQPAELWSEAGLQWMLARAIVANADLLVARRDGDQCAVLLVGEAGATVLSPCEPLDYQGICDRMLDRSIGWTPSMPGQWRLPGKIEYQGRQYLVCVSSIRSAGAQGLKLRPLRIATAAEDWIEEYRCEERDRQIVFDAVQQAQDRLGLMVTGPGVDWQKVLYCWLQGLSRGMSHALYVGEMSRFAISSLFQYPFPGDLRLGALGSLVAYTGATRLTLDRPLTVEEWRYLRASRPGLSDVMALYRATEGRPGGSPYLPACFWEALESEPEAVVLLATTSGVECLTAPDATRILSDWK